MQLIMELLAILLLVILFAFLAGWQGRGTYNTRTRLRQHQAERLLLDQARRDFRPRL